MLLKLRMQLEMYVGTQFIRLYTPTSPIYIIYNIYVDLYNKKCVYVHRRKERKV